MRFPQSGAAGFGGGAGVKVSDVTMHARVGPGAVGGTLEVVGSLGYLV